MPEIVKLPGAPNQDEKKLTLHMLQKLREENEILEIQYMGKTEIQKQVPDYQNLTQQEKANTKKVYRQFLVRRKRHLEIMLTNGLTFWTEQVPQSKVTKPYYIQDMTLSKNNSTLVIQVALQDNDASFYSKIYKYNNTSNNFEYDDSSKWGNKNKQQKNLALDKDGEIYSIDIEITNVKIKANWR